MNKELITERLFQLLITGERDSARKMVDEIMDVQHRVRTDSGINALVLAGNGRSFCAGYDLAEADSGDKKRNIIDTRDMLQRDFDMTIEFWKALRFTLAFTLLTLPLVLLFGLIIALVVNNAWSLYDVHGNAYEWVADTFGRYEDAPKDPKLERRFLQEVRNFLKEQVGGRR